MYFAHSSVLIVTLTLTKAIPKPTLAPPATTNYEEKRYFCKLNPLNNLASLAKEQLATLIDRNIEVGKDIHFLHYWICHQFEVFVVEFRKKKNSNNTSSNKKRKEKKNDNSGHFIFFNPFLFWFLFFLSTIYMHWGVEKCCIIWLRNKPIFIYYSMTPCRVK